MRPLPDDFREFLVELIDAGVEFVLVGGYAVAFHGFLRATKDLDVLVRGSPANAERTYAALAAFGAPISMFEVKVEDFATYEGFFTMGRPPHRIDVLNKIAGVSFDEAMAGAEHLEVDGRAIPVIGRAALIKNKRAAGRPSDLRDVEVLTSGEDH